uniref:Putative secreted protein n=1 Tax=Ixodes ricinus TaxID=34613 RepID=A0A6B0U5V9_IXORI
MSFNVSDSFRGLIFMMIWLRSAGLTTTVRPGLNVVMMVSSLDADSFETCFLFLVLFDCIRVKPELSSGSLIMMLESSDMLDASDDCAALPASWIMVFVP